MQAMLTGIDDGKINRLVFLTPYPISTFEKEKWCFEYLRSEGFDIQVLNLGKLFSGRTAPNSDNAAGRSNNNEDDFVHHIASYSELDKLIRDLSPDSLFIDYLVGVSDVTFKEERVFRILKTHNARFTFLLSGALPLPSSLAINIAGKLKLLQSKAFKALTSPRKFLNYLSSKVILWLTNRQILYSLPTMVFGGDSDVLRSYIRKRNYEDAKVIRINSTDYDASVLLLRKLDGKLPESQNVCVFLDEAATHHPDFALLGVAPPTSAVYFSRVNSFFDFIEQSTGLEVLIAAHPHSNYESMPGVFGKRAVIKGKTAELVLKSKLVVMHWSTSVSYAVLFRKPVIAIKFPGLGVNSHMNMMVRVMATALGTEAIDLEREEVTPAHMHRVCNLASYVEYEKRYVKTEGAAELPVWEIVATAVKNMH